MARIALLYGTTEGQTGIIAERMAAVLDEAGHDPVLFHAGHRPAGFSLAGYDAVVIGASVHVGSHQRYIIRFVSDHVDELNSLPSAFFSVSLTAAEGSAEAWETARSMLETFLAETGWEPDATAVVPGALTYSQYGTLKRFVMKRIAKRAGGDTDTSRDYEYTDWDEVESFAATFADALD
jgi:menaquinone-dependent protoporphyrinogen oxidase